MDKRKRKAQFHGIPTTEHWQGLIIEFNEKINAGGFTHPASPTKITLSNLTKLVVADKLVANSRGRVGAAKEKLLTCSWRVRNSLKRC